MKFTITNEQEFETFQHIARLLTPYSELYSEFYDAIIDAICAWEEKQYNLIEEGM